MQKVISDYFAEAKVLENGSLIPQTGRSETLRTFAITSGANIHNSKSLEKSKKVVLSVDGSMIRLCRPWKNSLPSRMEWPKFFCVL